MDNTMKRTPPPRRGGGVNSPRELKAFLCLLGFLCLLLFCHGGCITKYKESLIFCRRQLARQQNRIAIDLEKIPRIVPKLSDALPHYETVRTATQ